MPRHSWSGWTVTIKVENRGAPPVDDEALDRFLDLMNPYGGAISGRADHGGYGATFSQRMTPTNPVEVLADALELFRRLAGEAGLPGMWVVHCEVMTFAYHDRESAAGR